MNLPLPAGAAPSEIQETGGPTARSPSPGSAASLLGFALLILQTDLRETGPAIPILTVFCGMSIFHFPFYPVLRKLLVNPCYHHPTVTGKLRL